MSIYLAAPWELKDIAIEVAKMIEEEFPKFTCKPQWFNHKDGDDQQECIQHDLDDIENASIFLLLNPVDWKYKGTGGRHFETGYAFLSGCRLIIYGARTNLFHNHKAFTVAEDYNSLKKVLADINPSLVHV